MPSVQTSIEYLQKLALYEEEKPYWCFLPPSEDFDPDVQRVDNLEFIRREGRKHKSHLPGGRGPSRHPRWIEHQPR